MSDVSDRRLRQGEWRYFAEIIMNLTQRQWYSVTNPLLNQRYTQWDVCNVEMVRIAVRSLVSTECNFAHALILSWQTTLQISVNNKFIFQIYFWQLLLYAKKKRSVVPPVSVRLCVGFCLMIYVCCNHCIATVYFTYHTCLQAVTVH